MLINNSIYDGMSTDNSDDSIVYIGCLGYSELINNVYL